MTDDQQPSPTEEQPQSSPASNDAAETAPEQQAAAGEEPGGANAGPKEEPLRSVHTSNLPNILEHFGISLLVTTYQAGKLVIVRPDGGLANTHFRNFKKPMGMAFDGNRLAIGTAQEVWEFRNVPQWPPNWNPKAR